MKYANDEILTNATACTANEPKLFEIYVFDHTYDTIFV